MKQTYEIFKKKVDNGDEVAKYYLDGMCYQVAKSIAEMSVTLEGKVDYIILTERSESF